MSNKEIDWAAFELDLQKRMDGPETDEDTLDGLLPFRADENPLVPGAESPALNEAPENPYPADDPYNLQDNEQIGALRLAELGSHITVLLRQNPESGHHDFRILANIGDTTDITREMLHILSHMPHPEDASKPAIQIVTEGEGNPA